MAGVKIIYDNAELGAGLAVLRDRLGDLEPFYRDIGELLKESTESRFESQTDPDGKPWAPLSTKYLNSAKKRPHPKILILSGELSHIVVQASSVRLEVGSNRVYAAIQQLGGPVGKAKAAKAKLAKKHVSSYLTDSKRGVIPARAFLGVSPQDLSLVSLRLQEYLSGSVTGN